MCALLAVNPVSSVVAECIDEHVSISKASNRFSTSANSVNTSIPSLTRSPLTLSGNGEAAVPQLSPLLIACDKMWS